MSDHYKGRIENWKREYVPGREGLGYIIVGRFLDHPHFALDYGHTSVVVAHDSETGVIRTRNSSYTLVGKEQSL